MVSDWPDQLTINAWADAPVNGPVGPDARRWILHQDVEAKAHDADQTLAARPDRPADWSDPEVGWGVVLPSSDLPVGDQARLADAPAAIRRLAEARAGPDGPAVFRWAPQNGYTSLLRVYQNGDHQPTAITGGVAGSGRGGRPKYLLLVGPPAALPWELQCRLNLSCAVGRLDLPDEALERYVDALLCDWNGADIDATRPVIWATDYDNITGIMRDAIAEPVAAKFRDDPQVRDGLQLLVGIRCNS